MASQQGGYSKYKWHNPALNTAAFPNYGCFLNYSYFLKHGRCCITTCSQICDWPTSIQAALKAMSGGCQPWTHSLKTSQVCSLPRGEKHPPYSTGLGLGQKPWGKPQSRVQNITMVKGATEDHTHMETEAERSLAGRICFPHVRSECHFEASPLIRATW